MKVLQGEHDISQNILENWIVYTSFKLVKVKLFKNILPFCDNFTLASFSLSHHAFEVPLTETRSFFFPHATN